MLRTGKRILIIIRWRKCACMTNLKRTLKLDNLTWQIRVTRNTRQKMFTHWKSISTKKSTNDVTTAKSKQRQFLSSSWRWTARTTESGRTVTLIDSNGDHLRTTDGEFVEVKSVLLPHGESNNQQNLTLRDERTPVESAYILKIPI